MIALPWMIKDWIWLGNPVSPFLNRVFPNPYIHVQFEESYRAYFRHYELDQFPSMAVECKSTGEEL